MHEQKLMSKGKISLQAFQGRGRSIGLEPSLESTLSWRIGRTSAQGNQSAQSSLPMYKITVLPATSWVN